MCKANVILDVLSLWTYPCLILCYSTALGAWLTWLHLVWWNQEVKGLKLPQLLQMPHCEH